MDVLVVFCTPSRDSKNLRYTISITFYFLESTQTSQAYLDVERTNVLKRSQCNLTSIIRSFAQWRFNANNECPVVVTRCSTAVSRFGVVSSKIPRYLKVYTRSIASPSNTNCSHGSTKLNTMTFIFFTFIVNPRSTQNCWIVSNCCYNPTFDSDIKARSSVKNSGHMCTFFRIGASHSLPLKCPSRASKYSPNSRG
jgi:hypothetical protein